MYKKVGASSFAAVLLFAAAVTAVTYVIVKYKSHKTSAWQRSVEKMLASKKSGRFEAKDKTGQPVILEWLKTNVHEPEYAQTIHMLENIVVQAFIPVELKFLKVYPDSVSSAEKGDLFEQLKALFKNGVELVDWKLVEEKLGPIMRSAWQSMTNEESVGKFGKTIFFFVMAKEPATGKLLGFICYRIGADAPQGTAEIEPLAIVPEEQKRGLGKLLVSSLFRIIPGLNYLWLGTSKTNDVAIAAYTALGFIQHPADPRDKSVGMEYRAERSDILQKAAAMLKDEKK